MKRKAFTLIELLVVIAVIGLISSIVLVNLRGARGKAKIAKGLSLSQSINHALGAYAVGVWSFDKVNGTVTDLSGYDNHCIVYGATPAEGIIRQALEFNSSESDYLDCGNNRSLDITDAITVEAWIKQDSFSVDNAIFSSTAGWQAGYGARVDSNGTVTFFYNLPGGPDTRYQMTLAKPTNQGEWNHVCFVFEDSTHMYIYLNGGDVSDTILSAPIAHDFRELRIGRLGGSSLYFNGTIDEVRIYEEALTAGQIQKHYVEGLERLKLVEK